ncbi:hypothetical protein FACS189450_13120 [Spirochaetia bacterium]|nr:hypothetical protein FACS189450_13120 [Spirochaetia bacterium]
MAYNKTADDAEAARVAAENKKTADAAAEAARLRTFREDNEKAYQKEIEQIELQARIEGKAVNTDAIRLQKLNARINAFKALTREVGINGAKEQETLRALQREFDELSNRSFDIQFADNSKALEDKKREILAIAAIEGQSVDSYEVQSQLLQAEEGSYKNILSFAKGVLDGVTADDRARQAVLATQYKQIAADKERLTEQKKINDEVKKIAEGAEAGAKNATDKLAQLQAGSLTAQMNEDIAAIDQATDAKRAEAQAKALASWQANYTAIRDSISKSYDDAIDKTDEKIRKLEAARSSGATGAIREQIEGEIKALEDMPIAPVIDTGKFKNSVDVAYKALQQLYPDKVFNQQELLAYRDKLIEINGDVLKNSNDWSGKTIKIAADGYDAIAERDQKIADLRKRLDTDSLEGAEAYTEEIKHLEDEKNAYIQSKAFELAEAERQQRADREKIAAYKPPPMFSKEWMQEMDEAWAAIQAGADSIWNSVEHGGKTAFEVFAAGVKESMSYAMESFRSATDSIMSIWQSSLDSELEYKLQQNKAIVQSDDDRKEAEKKIRNEAAEEQYKADMAQYAANIVMATGAAAMAVLQAMAGAPGPTGIAMAAIAGVLGALQVAAVIAAVPIKKRFHSGGIVGGTGDQQITAKGKEMVLTEAQQARLFQQLNGSAAMGNGGGGGDMLLNVNIENNAKNTQVETGMDKNGLRVIIREMVGSMIGGGELDRSFSQKSSRDAGVSIE